MAQAQLACSIWPQAQRDQVKIEVGPARDISRETTIGEVRPTETNDLLLRDWSVPLPYPSSSWLCTPCSP